MSAILNDRDVLLQGATTRAFPATDRALLLTSDAPAGFKMSADGTTATPATITFTATLLGMTGTVAFSSSAGLTLTISGNTATLPLAAMTTETGTVTAAITVDGVPYSRTVSLSKMRDGANGVNAAWVAVSATPQVFTRANSGAAFAPASITLSATPYGGTASYQWQYWTGSVWANVAGATTSTLAVASGAFTDARTYRVQATIGGGIYTDEMTLVQLTGGMNGVSAITGFLTNEATTLAADSAGTVSSFAPAGGTFKVYEGITDKTGTAGPVTYSVPSQTGCTADITSAGVYSVSAMSADTASAVLQAVYGGVTIQKTLSLSKSRAGTSGATTGTSRLYQWSTAQPSLPTGTATFTAATAATTAYNAADGWKVAPDANPGTPGIKLWIADKGVSVAAGSASVSVSYSSGASIAAYTQNGTNGTSGLQAASPTVYRWDTSLPANPVGSPTFNWPTQGFGAAPANWALTPGTSPSPGYTLWAAKVALSDSATVTDTAFNWSSASVSAVGYASHQGASYVTAYCASSSVSTSTAPAPTTGQNSLPSGGGVTGTWTKTTPNLAADQRMWQTDGIYNPANNTVVWSVPYVSSVKYGSVSAMVANLGDINAGNIDLGGGKIKLNNDGSSVFKAITVVGAGDVPILTTTGLTEAGAAPGTKNSDISLTPTGGLSGGGGGQITTIPVRDWVPERSTNRPPSWYPVGTTREFKESASVGLGGADNYLTLETIIQYPDASGGAVYQYAYRGTTTFRRWGTAGASSWAGAWVQDLDRNAYTGDLNATRGADWNSTLANKPADSALLNAFISIGADGQLTGGGGGKVTLSGMGQKTFRVISYGNAVVGLPATAGLYTDGVLTHGTQRSYALVVIRRDNGTVDFYQTYDVYGNGEVTAGRNAATLAGDLNYFGSDKIVVVFCADEPKQRRLEGGLPAAMYRCGASRNVFGSVNFKSHSAYILVGIPGCGEGNGAEAYQGAVDQDPNAWCDIGFNVVKGALTGVSTSYTPKSLTDYGYMGDLNATSNITLIGRGVEVTGNSLRKTGAAYAWDADAYSKESAPYAYASATVTSLSGVFFGLNDDPTLDATYTGIFASFYIQDGTSTGYASINADFATSFAVAIGDVLRVSYDGVRVRWFKNGSQVREYAVDIGGVPLYFDSSFVAPGGTLGVCQFGPIPSAIWAHTGGAGRPQDNATVGATLGTNVSGSINDTNAAGLVTVTNLRILTPKIGNYSTAGTGGQMDLGDNAIKILDGANGVRVKIGNQLV